MIRELSYPGRVAQDFTVILAAAFDIHELRGGLAITTRTQCGEVVMKSILEFLHGYMEKLC